MIAGQGTIGLEIVEALPDISTVVVPIGGGGLISGIATAVKALKPDARIIGVQAENVAWVNPSLKAGHAVFAKPGQTIADGIAVKSPGELTLPIIRELVEEVVEVQEEEIALGIFLPGSTITSSSRVRVLPALRLCSQERLRSGEDETVCAVLCGGNIDANLFARVLEQVLVRQGRYIMLKASRPRSSRYACRTPQRGRRMRGERYRGFSPPRDVARPTGQRRDRNAPRGPR